MKRDKILKMPAGREMNELFEFRVMGYSKLPLPAVPTWQKPSAEGLQVHFDLPNYSGDIAAAWEVVERLRTVDEYICPQIYWDDNDGLEPGEWVVEFNRYAKTKNDYRHTEAVAPTAPLAISRAALLVDLEAHDEN